MKERVARRNVLREPGKVKAGGRKVCEHGSGAVRVNL